MRCHLCNSYTPESGCDHYEPSKDGVIPQREGRKMIIERLHSLTDGRDTYKMTLSDGISTATFPIGGASFNIVFQNFKVLDVPAAYENGKYKIFTYKFRT